MHGTQQRNPEATELLAESILGLVNTTNSIVIAWYLDDGNLADEHKVVLKDLERIMSSEKLGVETKLC